MGVVIEMCAKHLGGPTRITVTDLTSRRLAYICPLAKAIYSDLAAAISCPCVPH
jgi:hypothetical protein